MYIQIVVYIDCIDCNCGLDNNNLYVSICIYRLLYIQIVQIVTVGQITIIYMYSPEGGLGCPRWGFLQISSHIITLSHVSICIYRLLYIQIVQIYVYCYRRNKHERYSIYIRYAGLPTKDETFNRFFSLYSYMLNDLAKK